MVLVDTSVWIAHFKQSDPRLQALLLDGQVLTHPMVIGELMLGDLKQRDQVFAHLSDMPQAAEAQHNELLAFIDAHHLQGQGIGWVDCHLLAACKLAPSAKLWTLDKRLRAVAERLKIADSIALH